MGISEPLGWLKRYVDSKKVSLTAILAIGLAVRLLLSLGTTGILWPDSLAYYNSAVRIAGHFDFIAHTPYRTVLYPLFMSVFFFTLGANSATGVLIILTQRLLGLLSAIFFYKTARRVFSPGVALLSSLFFVVNPLQLYYETVVQTELLFVFFLSIVIWQFVRILSPEDERSPELGQFALLGFYAGLLTLTRPIGKLILPVFLLILLIRRTGFRLFVKRTLLSLAVFSVVLFPWMLVNRASYGFWGISSDMGLNTFHRVFDLDNTTPAADSHYPQVKSIYEGVRGQRQVVYFLVYHALRRHHLSHVETDKLMTAFALEALRNEPGKFLPNTLVTLYRFFFDTRDSLHFCGSPSGEYLCSPNIRETSLEAFPNSPNGLWLTGLRISHRLLGLLHMNMGFFSALFFAGILLFFQAGKPRRMEAFTLIALTFYFAGLTAVFNTPEDRFSLPVFAIIFMFAAQALISISSGLRKMALALFPK